MSIYREPAEMIKETRAMVSGMKKRTKLFWTATSIFLFVGGFQAGRFAYPVKQIVEKPVERIVEKTTIDPGVCRSTILNHYWGNGPETITVCPHPDQTENVVKFWDNGMALVQCTCHPTQK